MSFGGALHVRGRLNMQHFHIEIDILVPIRAVVCEQGPSLRRDRHVRHQCDEMVDVSRRPLETFNVAMFAREGYPFAATVEKGVRKKFKFHAGLEWLRRILFVARLVDVIGRAIFVRATIASLDVRANFIRSAANIFRLTFIDVLARASIAGDAIARRAGALIRAVRVLAETHAQIGRFVHFAFVDVFAGAIVGAQMESGFACATVRAPIVDAALRAKSRIISAFVDVHANFFVAFLALEAFLAVAAIRSNRVHTLRIRATNLRK